MVKRADQTKFPFVDEEIEGDNDVQHDDDALETAAPIAAVSWPIQIAKAERTIFELHRSWKNEVLDLSPDFQREFVWDRRRKIKLVESVLARIPLPVFYLSEENEDLTIVIDGQQRLTTLFQFKDGQFDLRGLTLLPELNGKRFGDLDPKLQRRFENTPLTCFVVQPGTNLDVKFQIFERLNEGAIALNAQEIRNSLYRGPGLDMVKRLAQDDAPGSFRDVAGPEREYRRMRADELVLRCLAFLDLGADGYDRELKGFLNMELKRLNTATKEEREALQVRLRDALARSQAVFKKNAFCRYNPQDNTWSTQLNGPLLEIIVYGFDRCFPGTSKLPRKTERVILDKFKELSNDTQFRDAITFATQALNTVKLRFDLWMKVLADVA